MQRKKVENMTSATTKAIKNFATDREESNSLLALLDYYGRNSLMEISEQEALAFLAKLTSGEIRIPREI